MSSDNQTFTAGVRPGGPRSTDEVLVLLCYIMEQAGEPVSFDQLNEALQKQELVNYFEFADMVQRMCEKGYAQRDNEGRFVLTERGRLTARECTYNLPVSVMERGKTALENILTRERNERENDFTVQKEENGWRLRAAVRDGDCALMRVELLMPDEESCERIRRRFLSEPGNIYRGVIGTLTGDQTSAGAQEPAKDLYE